MGMKMSEITESSGQIIAKMLGAINHPEFFDYDDIKASPPIPVHPR
jgi:hypothetical protein